MFYAFSNNDMAQLNNNPSAPFRNKWCDAWEIDRISGDAERCPECGRYVSGKEWKSPRKIRLTSARYPDRLSTWLAEPLVVSERFADAYKAAQLVGIRDFLPIEQIDVAHTRSNTHQPPRYYCAKIDFSQDVRVDFARSEIYGQKYDWSCPLCNPRGMTIDRIKRLVLDSSAWAGEDIFRVYCLGIVVSQRFYDFAERNRFTNFPLVPIDEYQVN